MLKASALYIVIIIALVIAVFSASLITTAYFYRSELQKNMRYDKLLTNINSGAALLLSTDYKQYDTDILTDLFGDLSDSVILRKEKWGIYDLALVKSYTLNDTLKKAFMIAEYSNDTAAMYISDEDRPISISGATYITGDVFVPRYGIKQAYVEGKPCTGLVNGALKPSARTLPVLSEKTLDFIEYFLNDSTTTTPFLGDSLVNSFVNKAQVLRINKSNASFDTTSIRGKVILLCDSTLTLGRNVNLKDVLVFAKTIMIEEGFRGTCQLFARDSIVAGKNTVFNYPSCMGIIKTPTNRFQPKIVLGSGSVFSGILFTYEKKRSDLQTQVHLGKNSLVKGEVYASGFIRMVKPVTVEGKVSCNRFIIQTSQSLYENYLIDITINRKKRSKYYLSSSLFSDTTSSATTSNKRILKWVH